MESFLISPTLNRIHPYRKMEMEIILVVRHQVGLFHI